MLPPSLAFVWSHSPFSGSPAAYMWCCAGTDSRVRDAALRLLFGVAVDDSNKPSLVAIAPLVADVLRQGLSPGWRWLGRVGGGGGGGE